MTIQQRHWYNDKEVFLHGLARSSYITAFTDWFMGLAGKLTEIVLYGTVLYSCAQLYPGVSLPNGLSLTVFLVQMGALDIGGLALGKLAKQAREDGNAAGAEQAEALSKWLIGIMLTGVVTVGIEHVIAIPGQVQTGVEIVLVVARSMCSVLYGRVVHALKREAEQIQQVMFTERFTELSERITESEQRMTELVQRTANRLSVHFTEQLERTCNEHATHTELAHLTETVQVHTQTLAELAALPGLFEQLQQAIQAQVRTVVQQEVQAAMEANSEPHRKSVPNTERPKLSVVEAKAERRAPNSTESDKGAFVRHCLTETPNMRNADIQRKASEQGITISPAYISEIRKAFFEREQTA